MEARLAAPPPIPPFDLGAHLFATAVLDVAALLIAALICVALGVFMRFRPRVATAVIATARPLGMAVPVFVLGPLLVFFFNFQLHLFPVGAIYGQTGQLFEPGRLFLPALTLAIGALALTLAQVRSRMFAFARADSSWAASWGVIGLYLLGATISWTFVVEIIFDWPGIGSSAFVYGIFFFGSPDGNILGPSAQDLGILWSIVLVTSAVYLVVALATGTAARLLGRRGAVTDAEPDAPQAPDVGRGGGRSLPRWAALTLLGIGTALVAAVALATIFAPLLTRYNPGHIDISLLNMNSPPSAAHPLGTDDLGRDTLSELLYMGRVSLAIGALAVGAAAVSGLGLGALLNLLPTARRRIGALVDGALTALMAFPTLFLALWLFDLLYTGFTSLVVAFAIVQVPTFARLGLTLMRTRGRETADRSPVAQRRSTPVVIGQLLAQASSSMAIVLVEVSALTFFLGTSPVDLQAPPFNGVGPNYAPPLFDWGALIGAHGPLLTDAQGPQVTLPLSPLAAAFALGICVLGFTLVGQALRSLVEERVVGGSKRFPLPQAS